MVMLWGSLGLGNVQVDTDRKTRPTVHCVALRLPCLPIMIGDACMGTAARTAWMQTSVGCTHTF